MEHPDRQVEYFCLNCEKPICVQCKLKGSHQSERHGTIMIESAYSEAKAYCLDDNNIDKKKKHLKQNL